MFAFFFSLNIFTTEDTDSVGKMFTPHAESVLRPLGTFLLNTAFDCTLLWKRVINTFTIQKGNDGIII